MFGPLGVPELLFILGLALLIFGPRKLPEIGRTLGKGMSEFRKASNELKRTLNAEVALEEVRQNDPRRILKEAIEEPLKDPPQKAESSKAASESGERRPAGEQDSPGGTIARQSGSAGASDPDPESKESASPAPSTADVS